MLGTFQQQVASGGPITVTDPDVSRFFMTVEEAVALTIQAGALGRPGEVLVLDMGKPVKILDVAERLGEQSGQPIKIVFTGLREGEKLHEVLFGAGEVDVRPNHPLVSQVPCRRSVSRRPRRRAPWTAGSASPRPPWRRRPW